MIGAKRMSRKSRAEKIFIGIILLITVISIIYTWKDTEMENEYEYSIESEIPEALYMYEFDEIVQTFSSEYSKLNSLEIRFSNIQNAAEGSLTVTIEHGDSVLYQTYVPYSMLPSDTWYQLYVNIPIKQENEYVLRITAEEESTCVPVVSLVLEGDASPENITCSIDGEEMPGTLLIRYGYYRERSLGDKLISAAIIVLIASLAITAIMRRKQIRQWAEGHFIRITDSLSEPCRRVLCTMAEIALCCLLMECSGMEYQTVMQLIFYAVSLAAGYRFMDSLCGLRNELQSLPSRLAFGICAILGAFALVGNRTLVYPLDANVTPDDCLLFAAAVIWFIPVIALFLNWYGNLRVQKGIKKEPLSRIKFILLCLLLLLIPSLIALYAFNPGIAGLDTIGCLALSAHEIQGIDDWHPPFYIMILRLIIKIWDSTYAVIVVQLFFWAYVMTEAILLLADRGAAQKYLLLLALLMGISPANYLQNITLLKDTPYAFTLLWLTILLARLALNMPIRHKWYFYLELITALVFIFFMRHNGMVVYVLAVAALILVFRNNRGLMVSAVLSLGIVLFIKFPVYSYYDIQSSAESRGGIYIGLGQDILGVYYSGGELSDESLEIVRVLTSEDMNYFSYDPYRADSSYLLDISITDFIWNYIETFINNPVIMIREIVLRQDCVWDLFGGEDSNLDMVNYYATVDGYESWNNLYPERVTNTFTYALQAFQSYTVSHQYLHIIIWKSGIYTLFVTFAFLALLLRQKLRRNWLIFLPFAGQVISLMLTTGWNDFRYYWPLNLLAVFIVMLIPTIENEEPAANGSLTQQMDAES